MSRYVLANESSDILAVCRLIGMPVSDFSYMTSMKLYCPFGDVSHSDGGMSKAFRVYPDTNTAYCFACGEHFTPVKLLAMARDIPFSEAEDILLEIAGVTEANTEERWQQLIAEKEPEVNRSDLREALMTYCARIDERWKERQFEPAIGAKLEGCLSLLERVRTQQDAYQWLDATKTVMTKILGAKSERQADRQSRHPGSPGMDHHSRSSR